MTDKLAVKNDALAVFEDYSLDENMEGVEARIPRIKFNSQGKLFILPDDTPVKELRGIIAYSHRCNAYWEKSFDETGDGERPQCASLDALTPYTEYKCAQTCAQCKFNRFGSGPKGEGKACKNMRRVYIMLENATIPYLLTLPAGSLKRWDDFITKLTAENVPLPLAHISIKVSEAKNRSGIMYGVADIHKTDVVKDISVANQIKELRESVKRLAKKTDIVEQEDEGPF